MADPLLFIADDFHIIDEAQHGGVELGVQIAAIFADDFSMTHRFYDAVQLLHRTDAAILRHREWRDIMLAVSGLGTDPVGGAGGRSQHAIMQAEIVGTR